MLAAGKLGGVPAGSNDPNKPNKLDTNKWGIDEQGQGQPTISGMMMNGIGELRQRIMQPIANMINGGRLLPPNGTPVSSDGKQASGTKGSSKTTVGSGNKREALKILKKEFGSHAVNGIRPKDIPPEVARRLLAGRITKEDALELIKKSMKEKEEAKKSDNQDKQNNVAANDASKVGPKDKPFEPSNPNDPSIPLA